MNDVVVHLLVIGLAGGIGGMTISLLNGELSLPKYNKESSTWSPGWVGNVILGVVASIVVWGIYGSGSTFDFFHPPPDKMSLTVAQFCMSLGIGMGGGKVLTEWSTSISKNEEKRNNLKNIENLLGI